MEVTMTEKAAKPKPMAPIARIGTYGFMMPAVYGAKASEGICSGSHLPDFSYESQPTKAACVRYGLPQFQRSNPASQLAPIQQIP